jgi:CBS domain-containing membrane protein
MRLREKLIQSCLATLILGGIFELYSLVFDVGHLEGWHLVTSTSIAGTALLLFAFPHSNVTKYRTVIGGHSLSAAAAVAVLILASYVPLHIGWIYAGGIGLALLLMTVTEWMHPPAASTALTIAMAHTSSVWDNRLNLFKIITVVLMTIVLLVISHYILRGRLVNLEHNT